MAVANDKPSEWRNFAAWSAVGATFYILAICIGALLVNGEGVSGIASVLLRSGRLAATLGLGLILSTVVVGFSSRKRPLSLRTFRNYLILNAVAIIAFLLIVWGLSASVGAGALRTMHASEGAATVTGSILVFFAFFGSLATSSTHTRANLIDDEVAAEDLRERSRLFLCSFGWIAACGLLLIGLALARPGGVLSPAAALAGAGVLIAVLVVLGIVARRLSDELGRTLSRESGSVACYLILAVGGGWAILAHLGFAAAPAPLDWLTLFTVLLFVASFIAVGRRNLLTR